MRRDRAGWAAAAGLTVVLAALAWLRHVNYWSGAADLGIFDQGVWLMSRGRAPEVSIIGENLFADHLSMIVLLFVPLYRLVATPFWLVAVQAAALAVTVVPLRALAREEGAPPWVATAATVASAPILAAALYDFHPWALATPFVALLVLAVRRDDVALATVAAVGVVLCRTDLAVAAVAVALLGSGRMRRRLVLLAPVPFLAGLVVPSLLGGRQGWDRYYAHLGDGPLDVVTHPWRLGPALFSASAARTALFLLLPVGFLVLTRMRWLLALAVAALPLLFSSLPGTSQPWFHYGSALMPIAVGGALAALARPRFGWQRPSLLVAGAGAALLLASPLAPRAPSEIQVWSIVRPEPGVDLEQAVATVSDDEPVAAVNRALAHLVYRDQAYIWPCPFAGIEEERLCLDEPQQVKDGIVHVVVGAGDQERVAALGFDVRPIGGALAVGSRAR